MIRGQRIDEKNGVNCLVIAFRCYANDSTKLVTDCAKFVNAPERFCWLFSEKCMVNRVWSYCLWDIAVRNMLKKDF